MVVSVSISEFEAEVVKASESQLVIVDFYASWCGPCKVLSPILDAAEKNEKSASVKFCKFDIDNKPTGSDKESPAVTYVVRSVPTLIFFRNGSEVDRMTGVSSEDALLDKIVSNRDNA